MTSEDCPAKPITPIDAYLCSKIHKHRRLPAKAQGPTSPFEKCTDSLAQKLRNLKQLNILHQSLWPCSDGSSLFQILEFYGDAVLGERIAFFIMRTRRFASPHMLTQMRTAIVNNTNLSRVFDLLNLRTLIACPPSDRPLKIKDKADIVEAIIGELAEVCAMNLSGGAGGGAALMVKSVLEELLSFICYVGESVYFTEEASCSSVSMCTKEFSVATPTPSPSKKATYMHSCSSPTIPPSPPTVTELPSASASVSTPTPSLTPVPAPASVEISTPTTGGPRVFPTGRKFRRIVGPLCATSTTSSIEASDPTISDQKEEESAGLLAPDVLHRVASMEEPSVGHFGGF